jgi:hypothetical protein
VINLLSWANAQRLDVDAVAKRNESIVNLQIEITVAERV